MVDSNGHTPLHEAAKLGFFQVAEALIRAGANLEQPCNRNGNTALHEAAHYGRTAFCKMLLVAGANKGSYNRHLKTPSNLADANGHLRTVQTLASHVESRRKIGDTLTEIEQIEYGGRAGKKINSRSSNSTVSLDRERNGTINKGSESARKSTARSSLR